MDNLDLRPDPNMSREEFIEELGVLRSLTAGILGTVPGAIIVLDSQWHLVYLNNDAKNLFDSDEASLIGKGLAEIYPKELGRMLSPQMIKKILEGKENTVKKYTTYLQRWYKITALSSDHGIFIRLEDITADMLINRSLRLNEFSINHIKTMVFWFMTSGHIIYANGAASDTLGYTKEELSRMMAKDVELSYTANSWAGFVDDMKKSGSITFESNLRAKDGSIVPVEVTVNYLYYFGEEYLIALAQDITVRKQAENTLLEAKAQSELYLDLMGHDINNLNQVALGYLELADDMLKDDEVRELITKPLDAITSSSHLIDNVRKLQKLKMGGLNTEVINLDTVLTELQAQYSNIPDKDVVIRLKHDSNCMVMANGLIKDVFSNLISNAIKHSNKASVRIDLGLILQKENGNKYCKIFIEDNGPGIPDFVKKKIFTRFQRGSTKATGKGLGLYLVRTLVEDFHGTVYVEDRVPGDHTKGSRFVVMLPTVET